MPHKIHMTVSLFLQGTEHSKLLDFFVVFWHQLFSFKASFHEDLDFLSSLEG
jgi:hypothetical protein